MAKTEKIDKLVDQLRDHLDAGERVVASVLGAYEVKKMGGDSVRNGVMAATDRRLVFYAKEMGGYDLESFPYENITSFEQGKSKSGPSVTFIASGNQAKLKWINKGDMTAFMEAVRSRMGKRSAVDAGSAAPDIADQIRKLADLRDAGIVSSDEFEAKKTDLLSRM